MSVRLPNLIIAGPPKCGTSSLFFWLTAHPQVCGSKDKELWYFIDKDDPTINKRAKNTNYHLHGLEKYKSFFQHCGQEKIVTEATPHYIYQQTARDVFSSFPVTPKIIFLLRQPSKRLFSVFRFAKYRRKKIEDSITFSRYIYDLQEELYQKGATPVERTKYIRYLKKWQQQYDPKQLHVYLFENLKNNPLQFMQRLSKDIDIDETFWNNFDFAHRNKTVQIKSKVLHSIGEKLLPYVPVWLQEKVLFPIYYAINASPIPPVSEKEREVMHQLDQYYEPYNRELAQKFQLDLSPWREK